MYGLVSFDTGSEKLLGLTSNANTVLTTIQNNKYNNGYTNTDGGLRECYRVESSGTTGVLAPGQGWDGKMTRIVILVGDRWPVSSFRPVFWVCHPAFVHGAAVAALTCA